ncbi:MAG: sigma-70 family RNA polymerase sigma factor [Chloroflexi bacterium]|nr:sigma-70 family RNA polymerase sigma factor [Chloroflexota bacterium]
MPDEAEIVNRAKKGDETALAELYETYFEPVYRYVALRVNSTADAEDITEQVFLRMLEAIGSYQWRNTPFSAWLFRIAHNQVVDHWRRSARERKLAVEMMATSEVWRPVSAETALEVRLRLEELVQALKQLTGAQQRVVALRFGAELSLAETARIMGKSEGAVKALQHSALAAMRRILRKEEDEGTL